ncbi:hypothetical protein N0V82_005770 [Gnomoniopsis sp. IMI 355080]|nr:hypothetical protein N0V82_005770 [Gnomoniopsis sp. IMI 355080]
MAAVCDPGPAQKFPSSPPLTTTDRPDSMASFKSIETETVAATERLQNDNEDDDSLILAIRALRLLENPQAAATEAIQAFDPKANLHPDLVRLLVAAAVRHPDVAQGLIELGSSQNGHLIRRTPSGSLQVNGNGASRHASGLVHEISISSLLSSISESSNRRSSDPSTTIETTKPTLKRRLSVLSTKKAAETQPATPPRRKEKISMDSIKKICKANLKDTKESIDKLERADLDDETLENDELRRMAEECLGHETGKFALCLALTLRDEKQRWEAVQNLMDTMVDKLKLLLSVKGVFGPDGEVGLPGQDAFGIRDCWVVLSEPERERLATEDNSAWPKRLREVAQLSPHHALKAWEILSACEKIQEALAPSQRSSAEGRDSYETGAEAQVGESSNAVAKRQATAAASPQEITDRWAFFFDLLDEEAARRCFRELRLLRQLFNAAQVPSATNRAANLKSKAKKAFDMSRPDDDLERWLDTKWAITAMKGFMLSKAGIYNADGETSYENLDRLDNAFCKTFWGCLASGDHKRLAAEEGKQWVTDIMKVFDDRRRHDVMFRLRDILHFMQANM